MFVTVHATVGAIIGEQTNNIALAFALGFISHFVFDAIPHGDQNLLDNQPTPRLKAIKLIKMAAADFLMLGLTLWALFSVNAFDHTWPVLAGAFGAVLPDIIQGLVMLLPRTWKWMKWIAKQNEAMHYIFNGFTITFIPGFIIQLVTFSILLTFILKT